MRRTFRTFHLFAKHQLIRGRTINNILVIAEKQQFGTSLASTLRERGYHVTLEDSYGSDDIACRKFDMVIATNTSLPCHEIETIIPDIKARCPDARIIVLSGYCTDDWVADLKKKGIDEFLELPYDENDLLEEVEGLLSSPTP